MTDATQHTPTPWNCASRYSSVVGVPIINKHGKRVGNTALPDMPPEWDHMKRQAEIDAAYICTAVNSHAALLAENEKLRKALEEIVAEIQANAGGTQGAIRKHARAALAKAPTHSEGARDGS